MISKFCRSTRALARSGSIIQPTFSRIWSPYNAAFLRQFATKVQNCPNMGDSITEGVIVEWSKNVGEFCAVDDIVAIIETDKVSVEIRCEEAGTLTETFVDLEDTVEVGAKLFSIDTDGQPSAGGAAPPKQAEAPTTPATPEPAKASTPEPVKATPPPPKSTPAPAPTQAPKVVGQRSETRKPMSRMRQTIAKRLKESQDTAASLTTFNEIDMSNLMKMRKLYGEEFLKKHNVKLGFMSAFVMASVQALKDQPAVNASIVGDEAVY